MSFLTPDEISKLEANPELAAVAKKLKDGIFVPKERLDEEIQKKKELNDKLAQIEADRQLVEAERMKKAGEFEKLTEAEKLKNAELVKQLNAEKSIADQHRAYVKAKKAAAKEALKDDWLPEYDSDTFSLESLEKVVAKVIGANPPATVVTPPGKSAKGKAWNDMTPVEREKYLEEIKAGKHKQ